MADTAMADTASVMGLLERTKVSAYCESRSAARELGGEKLDDGRVDTCVACSPVDTVGAALRKMANDELSSMPVFQEGKFFGFVDMNDVIQALVTGPASDIILGAGAEETPCDTVKTMDKLTTAIAPHFMNQKVEAICGTDGELAYRGYKDSSLLDVVRVGFLNKLRSTQPAPARRACHRVGVFNFDPMFDTGATVYDVESISIISQMDIVRFIKDSPDALGVLKDKTLADLGLAQKDGFVMTAEQKTSALNTFSEMYTAGVSAVAVTDKEGKLVQNFSASDMRWLEQSSFGCLALPSVIFLACMASCRDPGDPVTVKRDERLINVMELMVQNEIHHIHVVNEDGYPESIVTPTDIMKVIVGEEPEPK